MRRSASISVHAAAIAVVGAIAGGAIGYLGLATLARPANVSSEIALIDRQADEAEHIKSQLKVRPIYPRSAVCEGGGDAGLSVIRQEVSALAVRSGGFVVVEVSGTPGAPDEANGGLQPVNLSIEGNGASASVIGFLQSLSTTTPLVFVDKLDLKSTDGKVILKLTGRLFCSPTHL